LALERLFADKTTMISQQEPVAIVPLPFSDSPALIACTAGPLADLLVERRAAGAPSLKEALGRWLIPRHAAHVQDAIEAGKILLWVEVAAPDDERTACKALLAHSSNSVGVHDLKLPGGY
jgi:hypothetical protein